MEEQPCQEPRGPRQLKPGTEGHRRWLEGRRRYSEECRRRREVAQASFDELGESIAKAVVEGGKTLDWAWETVKPFDLYQRWIVKTWIRIYRTKYRTRIENIRKARLKKKKRRDQRLKQLQSVLNKTQPGQGVEDENNL